MIGILLLMLLPAILGLPRFHAKSSFGRVFSPAQLSSATATASRVSDQPAGLQPFPQEVVIVGSGPIGLASAILLARRGVQKVRVFDQLAEPPRPDDANFWGTFRSERSYNIGLSGRGQRALNFLDAWATVRKYSAPLWGAAFWTPGSDSPALEPVLGRKYRTQCIERDRLVGALLEEVRERYRDQIDVAFNTRCTNVTWSNLGQESEQVHLKLVNENGSFDLSTSWVIGTDGARSTLRDAMAVRTTSFEDVNCYLYRTFPLHFPSENYSHWLPEGMHMSFSVRLKENILLEGLPTKENVHLAALLYKPNNSIISSIKTVDDAKKFFADYMPMVSTAIDEAGYQKLLSAPEARFPKFQFVSPKLHYSRSACLLGDAIHSVKPYFGLGVNSAFDDIMALNDCLDATKNDVPKALQRYSKVHAKEAKALVSQSQRMDRGFIYFVLPIIMDSIFGKLFPGVFAGSVVRCFQNEQFSFTGALRKKLFDRTLQIGILASLVTGILYGFTAVLKKLKVFKAFAF
eukprot:gene7803-8614_t